MNIAVLSEISAVDRNPAIVASLEGRGHRVLNAGMRSRDDPELTYIHTGFLAALLLNAGRADLVVGGCGTGLGFLNAALAYPGLVCGLLLEPLDAWLFRQINDGNCVSLALNKGYGWAGEVNLRLLFDCFFSVGEGTGYPPARRESQEQSRRALHAISRLTHRGFPQIIRELDETITGPALSFPGVREILALDGLADPALADALKERLGKGRQGR
jgi:ribose 5-phosphate isomerase RpiB